MILRRVLAAFAVLFGLYVVPLVAQQTIVEVISGDTIDFARRDIDRFGLRIIGIPSQDTLPAYQDTLPPIQLPPVQDTLPPIQLPPVQDTLSAYQDTLAAYQDTLPPYQDTIPCLCDTIPVPPDTVPEPPTVDPPGVVQGMTLTQADSFIVATWTSAEGADSYVVQGGENGSSWRFEEEGTYTVFSANMNPRASGSHWVCIFGQNPAGLSADGRCRGIVFTMPEPPPSLYLLSVSAIQNDMTGVQDVEEGDYYIHLNRPDGAWLGQGDISMPGVDSVVFVLDGFRNRESVYPYEATGGLILGIPVGVHTVTWEVYGTEPDSGQATFSVTAIVAGPNPDPTPSGLAFSLRGPVPMQDPTVDTLSANMVQVLALDVIAGDSSGTYTAMAGWSATLGDVAGTPLPDSLGWYWLPAPDTGTIFLSNGTDTWQGTY